jgi:hypothetical protein
MQNLVSELEIAVSPCVLGLYISSPEKWITLQMKEDVLGQEGMPEKYEQTLDVTLLSDIIFKNILGVDDKES